MICISQICIPPSEAVAAADPTTDVADVLSARGANLIGARLAYRPGVGDMFVFLELEDLATIGTPFVYGLRFVTATGRYEARITGDLGGSFALFSCDRGWGLACTKVAGLSGGFGTTGERIVFSLPLAQIGLAEGGSLSHVEAYSGLGSVPSGATKVLDRIRIEPLGRR